MISARRLAVASVVTLSVVGMAGLRGRAQAQDAYNFETKKGQITVVGCLQRQNFGSKDKFVLQRPSLGPADSVGNAVCESADSAATFQLEDSKRGSIDESMVGHWVEITGRLGGVQDSNGLRRLHARESKLLPVIAPQIAKNEPAIIEPPVTYQPPAATYQPPIASESVPAPIPEATGTSGVIQKKELPKTASELPLTGLLGLTAIAAGLSLRQVSAKRDASDTAE